MNYEFKYKIGGIKMLDKIAMITFLVIYIISFLIFLSTYLIVRKENKIKNYEEKINKWNLY